MGYAQNEQRIFIITKSGLKSFFLQFFLKIILFFRNFIDFVIKILLMHLKFINSIQKKLYFGLLCSWFSTHIIGDGICGKTRPNKDSF
jgi:hypothetical protein